MTQTDLLGQVLVDPGVNLTRRQRWALELIAEQQPLPDDELGAHLHQLRLNAGGRGHPSDQRCRFCKDEGTAMGRALRTKGLVRYLRGEGWYIAGSQPRPNLGSTGAGPGDLPEDF